MIARHLRHARLEPRFSGFSVSSSARRTGVSASLLFLFIISTSLEGVGLEDEGEGEAGASAAEGSGRELLGWEAVLEDEDEEGMRSRMVELELASGRKDVSGAAAAAATAASAKLFISAA